MPVSRKYVEEYGSCGCGGGRQLVPCTQKEVELLSSDWQETFPKEFEGMSGLIVMANQRAMNATTKVISPEFGMSGAPGCDDTKYIAAFCRGMKGFFDDARFIPFHRCLGITPLLTLHIKI